MKKVQLTFDTQSVRFGGGSFGFDLPNKRFILSVYCKEEIYNS